MSFATNMQSTALQLLSTYGQSVAFRREVEGTYDPSTAATGSDTVTIYNGYAHPAPYTANELRSSSGSTTDDLIQKGDVKLLTYTTTEPLVGDTVTLDTVVYRVMAVDKLVAQATKIAYKLQIRI